MESFSDKLRAIAEYLDSEGVNAEGSSTIEFTQNPEDRPGRFGKIGEYLTGDQDIIIRLRINNHNIRASEHRRFMEDLVNE